MLILSGSFCMTRPEQYNGVDWRRLRNAADRLAHSGFTASRLPTPRVAQAESAAPWLHPDNAMLFGLLIPNVVGITEKTGGTTDPHTFM